MKKIRILFRSHVVRSLCGGFLLVIVPVLVLCIVSGLLAMKSLRQEVENSYMSNIKLVSGRFSKELEGLQTTVATFFIDDTVVRLSSIQKDKTDLYEFTEFETNLKLSFSSQFIPANVIAVFPAQELAVSTRDGVERLSSYPLLSDLTQLADGKSFWALRPSCRDPGQTCLSIALGYVYEGQSRPILIVEIAEQDLAAQLEDLFQDSIQIQSSFFIDLYGNTVLFDKNGMITKDMVKEIWEEYSRSAEPAAFSAQHGGTQLRLVPSPAPGSSCVLGIAFNETEILMPILNMIWFMVVILLFGILAGSGYLLWTYRTIYEPVQQLVSSMQKVASGDMSVRVSILGKDEFSVMAGQFNSMVGRLDKLMKERYLSEVRLKKAQMKFLKSQINPHFLYNTLFGVYNMIKSEELEDAAEMVIYLGQYYQIGAHLEAEKLTLSEEMRNIELYLHIHQLRTGGRFSYTCEILDGLEEFSIPSLSLQTIVENSITHAFKRHQKSEHIRVEARREGPWILFLAEDNGGGISEEEKQAVLKRLQQPEGEEVHGLQNVFFRMQLMFGEHTRLEIEPVSPHGTRILIRVPAKAEPEIQEKEREGKPGRGHEDGPTDTAGALDT